MLSERRDLDLDAWLIQAEHSGIAELKSFAQGLRRDYAAVRAAFSSRWSNGQVEAQVNWRTAPETTDVWESQLRSASTTGITSCVVKCELCYRPQAGGFFSASRLSS